MTLAVTVPETADPQAPPERGSRIGRFHILDVLGMGGMGVVLSAYDPDLDRKVALKLLHAVDGRESLLAEAQAMARVSHPHIVAVHEVGATDGRGYVVMEQVDGTTLRGWMIARSRPWQEVLAILCDAGTGLAAAHRAGIVHRDFKPENVLVGEDGRPRVSDFGLASRTWSRAGTLSYMPPEQRAGLLVDARADQFAFCVTLWEALSGERPRAGQSAAPPGAPAWIYRALMRGLARDPGDRWPSMDALLAALRRRASLRTRLVILAGALSVIAASAFLAGTGAAAPAVCSPADVGAAWDEPRRAAVRAGFADERAWRDAGGRVDRWAQAWSDAHADTCRATRVEGRQSETLHRLRSECLAQHRDVLDALTGLWAQGAPGDAADLPALDECADVAALSARQPLPSEPAQLTAIRRARARLAAVEALVLSDRLGEARSAVLVARAAADDTGWAQVRAEAALAEGVIRARLADPEVEPHLLAAARLAGAAGDDRLAAAALAELGEHLGKQPDGAARARVAADLAESLSRRGPPRPRPTATILPSGDACCVR